MPYSFNDPWTWTTATSTSAKVYWYPPQQQWSGSTTGQLTVVNCEHHGAAPKPKQSDDPLDWLRERVEEITDLVAA